MAAKIDLTAPDLFGNDVAEDEEEDVFRAYAFRRRESEAFADPLRKICVARAYKGDGKSALLRLTADSVLERQGPEAMVIHGPASAISPNLSGHDLDEWVRAWKAAIFERVATEVGGRLGFAWDDDAISLVEQAEKGGFRRRNLVSMVFDRFSAKLSAHGATAELAGKKLGVANAEQLLKRWLEDSEPIWFILDDVDRNFQNTAHIKAKVATFFIACREAVRAVPELRIRASVRPNVWTTIKMDYEALSHVEQYVTDLQWSEEEIRGLLARRIRGYLVRTEQWAEAVDELPTDIAQRERTLIALVFADPVVWANKPRPVHVPLYTLSKHRPRWLIELSKAAASRASDEGTDRIGLSHIEDCLDTFGRRRIEDAVAEFKSQCSEVDELISAFSREREEFSTDELLDLVQRKILSHLNPRISGVLGQANATDVAAFLFEIGIVFARRDYPEGGYDHFTYSQRPTLLRSRADLDAGLRWEVHPVFRQALEIRDSQGRKVSESPNRRRRRIIRPKD